VFHPPVNTSADPTYDFLNSSGASTGSACGTPGANEFAPLNSLQDRCGPGPRQPLLVISPWAKQNYIDHTFTDQSSVIKFIEENWGVGGLGGGAFESLSGLKSDRTQNPPGTSSAGDLMSMFDFNQSEPRAPGVILNDQTGEVVSIQGQQGPGDQDGQNGANGTNAANSTNVVKEIPGKTPHVVCKATLHGKNITVKCTETGARHRAHRARVRITRGHRLIASGSGTIGRIRLKARGRVRHGIYLLKVTVPGAAVDYQVIVL
jgi:phospholipase C